MHADGTTYPFKWLLGKSGRVAAPCAAACVMGEARATPLCVTYATCSPGIDSCIWLPGEPGCDMVGVVAGDERSEHELDPRDVGCGRPREKKPETIVA